MRKGRSSRRSRVSRPLIGSKPPSSIDLSAEIAVPSNGPRVVVGSVPPSDPPPSGAPSDAPESLETKSAHVEQQIIAKKLDGPRANPNDDITSSPPPALVLPPISEVKKEKEDASKVEKKFASTLIGTPSSSKPEVEDSTQLFGSNVTKEAVALIAVDDKEKKNKLNEAKRSEAFAEGRGDVLQTRAKNLASTLVLGSTKTAEEPAKKTEEPVNTKRSFASTLAFGSTATNEPPTSEKIEKTLEAKSEVVAKPAVDLTSTKKIGSDHTGPPPKVEALTKTAPMPMPAVVEAKADTKSKSDSRGDSKSDSNNKKKKKSDEKEKSGNKGNSPLAGLGEIDEKFFSEGDLSRHITPVEHVEDTALTVPDKFKRKSDPVVVERRARFVRYVKWAVGVAAIVCLAAVARTTFTSKHPNANTAATRPISAEAPASPKAADPAAAPIAADPAAQPTATTSASAEAPASASAAPDPTAAAAPSADPSAAATAAAPTTETKPEEVTGDAKEEKKKARIALERRKLVEAIEAGEKSVALDPTDAEAWLILGASHQEKGDMASARKAYGSCIKEAKTGPKHECMKMPH